MSYTIHTGNRGLATCRIPLPDHVHHIPIVYDDAFADSVWVLFCDDKRKGGFHDITEHTAAEMRKAAPIDEWDFSVEPLDPLQEEDGQLKLF